MDPGAGLVRDADDIIERIERAGVDVARLQADDRWPTQRREIRGAHPSLAVGRHAQQPIPAQAQQPKRLDKRRVRLIADHDRDGRRAKQTVGLDRPSLARASYRVSRGGERGEVRERSRRSRTTPAVSTQAVRG